MCWAKFQVVEIQRPSLAGSFQKPAFMREAVISVQGGGQGRAAKPALVAEWGQQFQGHSRSLRRRGFQAMIWLEDLLKLCIGSSLHAIRCQFFPPKKWGHFLLCFSFYGHTCDIQKFPGRMSYRSRSCQPQPHQIRAASVTHATACSKPGSLTH